MSHHTGMLFGGPADGRIYALERAVPELHFPICEEQFVFGSDEMREPQFRRAVYRLTNRSQKESGVSFYEYEGEF